MRVATGVTIILDPCGTTVADSHQEPDAGGGLSSAHFARFAAALGLLVAISLYGVVLDNRELAISRKISLQTFRADQLEARQVELRLEVQQLQSPERLRAAVAEREAARTGKYEKVEQEKRR